MALWRKTWDRGPALQGMLIVCIVLLWCVPGVSACDGFLSVTSTPAGASVYIDGTYRGITPANNININAGQHSIRLSLNGYFDTNENLIIMCEKKYSPNYPLTPIPITTTPTAIYVTCRAPYECLLPNEADTKWGTGKYTQGDANPCGQAPHVVQKTQSTQFNMFCYRPTETQVPVPIKVQPPKQVIAAKIPAQPGAPNIVQINPDVKQAVPAKPAPGQYICADLSKTNCDGTCVDTNSDPKNCGECRIACIVGTCKNGECDTSQYCPPGTTLCNFPIAGQEFKPNCVNLRIDDNKNCGLCGLECYGFTSKCCNKRCIDPQEDLMNCGTCGKVCSYTEGYECHNGVCVNLESDSNNCGAKGVSCKPGDLCCNGECHSVQTDNDFCGSCDKYCYAGAGLQCCGGECVNIRTDRLNCGGCGNNGCVIAGHGCCEGTCLDLTSDTNNCGSCGHQCEQCQVCDQGKCQYPSADSPRQQGCELYHKLLYVPLNWKGDQKSFDDSVDEQVSKFTDANPLRACPFRIGVTKLSVTTQNNNGFTCSESECGVSNVLAFIQGIGINPGDYNVIIGLAQSSPCPDMTGCSNKQNAVWVMDDSNDRSTTAHEIGHIFGLVDEYCSNPSGSSDCRCNDGDRPNYDLQQLIDQDPDHTAKLCYESDQPDHPLACSNNANYMNYNCGDASYDGATTGDINWLDAGLGCDPNDVGGCCSCAGTDYDGCCAGNQNSVGGRCIMGPSGSATATREFCQHCKDWLATIDSLHCHSPKLPLNRTIVDVSMSIHPDNTVTKERIILTDGIPTTNYQRGTGYEIRTTDGGETVWNTTMNIYFDYNGPVQIGVDYSNIKFTSFNLNYRIPYDGSMKRLELYHNKTLIFSKDLNFCNNNGICDTTETHQTCPNDCPLNRKDGVCTPKKDGICDPDCLPGVDTDCSSLPLLPLVLGGGLIVVVVGGWYLLRKRKLSQK